MKRILFLIFAGFSIVACTSQSNNIRNEYISIMVNDGIISVECLFNDEMKIPSLDLIGEIDSFSKVRVTDDKWGRGESLFIEHGENKITTLALYKNNPYLIFKQALITKVTLPMRFRRWILQPST